MIGAKKLGRPIHWMSGRSEAFLSDNQARDIHSEAELALDDKGRFLALRVRNTGNLGAYIGPVGANIPTLSFARCLPALYDIKHIDISARCAFTNTITTAPYRGAGRPEANYVLERVVEEAARVTGIDPAKLRRRNLVPKSAMPYKTAVGTTYDSGDFAPILDKALALADYGGIKKRRREAKKRGKYRGIGISCMLEHSGGTPLEGAWLTFPGDGTLTVNLNVQSTGQGHASVFPPLIAERLGIPRDKVQHRHGDSAFEIAGYASVGSRSAMTAGASIVKCIDLIVEKGKRIAAMVLEAGGRRHRLRTRGVRRRRHRPAHLAVRARRACCRSKKARRDRGGPRYQGHDGNAAHLSQRRPRRRDRDRSGDRAYGYRRLHGGRRLRQHAQRHDRRRPVARRAWRKGSARR